MALLWVSQAALVAYTTVLALLCIYGLHRYFLVVQFYRHKNGRHTPRAVFSELPYVTVQLPMFNERYVAARIIEKTCEIDYPRDRFEVQVLDDSTDDTVEIALAVVERLRAQGINVVYLHRTDRTGYKAGALAEGLKAARGEFIAIFDADFLPPRDILQNTIHYFTDPEVGAVQCRWDHLNRDVSMLTEAQAILLDGHFIIEHTARNRSGRFMSFNGTAGVWRRRAIEEAGGWHHDTLTEDLDLSYRAQLKGWRFVFLPDITTPAELPPEMNAFKAQQHRWTKGGAQTCVKMLPRVLRHGPNWRVKVEAFFHLTSCVVYVLMVLLSLLIGPAMFAKMAIAEGQTPLRTFVEMLLFFVGTGSALAFYVVSQRETLRSWWDTIRVIPALMAIGIGIAFNNAVAALEGFFGDAGEFVRTPKFGDQARRTGNWRARLRGFHMRGAWQAWAELLIGCYLLACLAACFFYDNWLATVAAALPFMGIFIGGYFYVALQTLYGRWLARA